MTISRVIETSIARMLGAYCVAVAKNITVAHAGRAGQGAAELDGGGDQSIEHRLQIERRAAEARKEGRCALSLAAFSLFTRRYDRRAPAVTLTG